MPKTRPKSIPMELLEEVSGIIRLMGHAHRLKIAELLIEQSRPVGELAEAVGLPAAAVSQHLSHMKAHGIVSSRREGRTVLYEVVHPSAVRMIECIRNELTDDHC
jgi:DNA-binding transcriptional ArsR family regulator